MHYKHLTKIAYIRNFNEKGAKNEKSKANCLIKIESILTESGHNWMV